MRLRNSEKTDCKWTDLFGVKNAKGSTESELQEYEVEIEELIFY